MVDRRLISAKLTELAERIARVSKHAKPTAADLASDRDALELVSFNLMLSVQSCIDIASHIIADEGWPPALSLAEGFARLAEHGVVSPATQQALTRAVGLRNVVAHGYAGIDPALVHAATTAGLRDLDTFAREIAAWLS